MPSSSSGRLTPEPNDDGGSSATNGKCVGQGQGFTFGGAGRGVAGLGEEALTETPSEDDADADAGVSTHEAHHDGRKTSSWAPRLSKPAYSCTPSLAELERMSPEELSHVEGFSVSRAGVGSIRWLGPVDLNGVDLGKDVSLEPAFVSVYESEEDGGMVKPKRGEKLNVPCVCTLHGVMGKDPAKVERKTNAMNGATFLSYSPRTGDWAFETDGW